MSDDEENEEQHEEIANLYLMEDNKSSPPKSEVDSRHFFPSTSYSSHDIYDSKNKLQDAYYILYENNKILKEKFISLK